MSRAEFIERKINNVNITISTSHRWSIILFVVAILSVVASMVPQISISDEFLKFGLSSMTTVSGTALQGLKYIRKNKLTELEYSLDKVNDYEKLDEFDKKIVDSALD